MSNKPAKLKTTKTADTPPSRAMSQINRLHFLKNWQTTSNRLLPSFIFQVILSY